MHEERVQKCLASGTGTLIDELAKESSDDAALDQLFLSVLTRKPTDDERAELLAILKKNNERRNDVLTNLAWAMLTSTEFVVNH